MRKQIRAIFYDGEQEPVRVGANFECDNEKQFMSGRRHRRAQEGVERDSLGDN